MSTRTQVICIIKNQELAENVKSLLERDGYDVMVASDTHNAVDMLNEMHSGYVIASEDVNAINEACGLQPLYSTNVPFVIFHKASFEGATPKETQQLAECGAWEDIVDCFPKK